MGVQTDTTFEQGLAAFQDKESQISDVVDELVPFPKLKNPYPDQTPKAIMERWAFISSFSGIDSGTTLQQVYNGVDALINNLVIGQPAMTFRYLRFKKIEYRIQFSTQPMIYGWFAVTCLPDISNNGSAQYTAALLSHTDTILVDLSEQQDITISSPWLSPSQWIDLLHYNSTGYTATALVNLHPLRMFFPPHFMLRFSSEVTLQTLFQVYARFVGVEVAGHLDDNTITFQAQDSRTLECTPVFESQMKASSPGQYVNNVVTKGGAFAGAASQILSMAMRAPSGDLADTVNAAQSVAAVIGPKKNPTKQKSASEEAEQDLKPNVYGSLTVSNPKYILGTGGQFATSRTHSILRYLQEPSFLTSYNWVASGGDDQNVTVATVAPVCLPDGPYSSATIQYGRISFVSQMFRYWRGSIRFTFIFFSSPFISARYNIILCYRNYEGVPNITGRFGSEVIQDITVKGTTRVDFEVPFLSAVQWMPCSHQLVSGLTDVRYMVPVLIVKQVNRPYTSGDLTATVPMLVYWAAGDDFQFRSQICPSPTWYHNAYPSKFESQMKVSELCLANPINSGRAPLPNASDDVLDVEGMCSRWNESTAAAAFGVYAGPQPPTKVSGSNVAANSGVCSAFSLWASVFLFMSGSIKLKIPFIGSVTDFQNFQVKMADHGAAIDSSLWPYAQLFGAEPIFRAGDGMSIVSQNLTSVLECLVPFLCSYEMVSTRQFLMELYQSSSGTPWDQLNPYFDPIQPYKYGLNCGTSTTTYAPAAYWVAAGSDFSFYYSLPPPSVFDGENTSGGETNDSCVSSWPRQFSTNMSDLGIVQQFFFQPGDGKRIKGKKPPYKCSSCGRDCRYLGSESCSESITLSSDSEPYEVQIVKRLVKS